LWCRVSGGPAACSSRDVKNLIMKKVLPQISPQIKGFTKELVTKVNGEVRGTSKKPSDLVQI
jgi:hypothetical protein